MNICIAATAQQQEQLMIKGFPETVAISWVANTAELLKESAEALIDCTFCADTLLQSATPFLFHSPVNTLADVKAQGRAGRFCAWNTFLQRETWDIAITDNENNIWINTLMTAIGWKFCLVQDEPGLVAPRIVANIINEAWYALQAGISTKEEIDLAMRLGTNYPYGPFEWADKIGFDNVNSLLKKLSIVNPMYHSAFATNTYFFDNF